MKDYLVSWSYKIVVFTAIIRGLCLFMLGFGSSITSSNPMNSSFAYENGLRALVDSPLMYKISVIVEYAVAIAFMLALVLAFIYDWMYSKKCDHFIKVALLEFIVFMALSVVTQFASKIIVWFVYFLLILILFGFVFLGPYVTLFGSLGVIIGGTVLSMAGILGPLLAIAAVVSFFTGIFG